MKILNLYFSSTGNTAKVANRITATAEYLGHQIDTVKGHRGPGPGFTRLRLHLCGFRGLSMAARQGFAGVHCGPAGPLRRRG